MICLQKTKTMANVQNNSLFIVMDNRQKDFDLLILSHILLWITGNN